MKSKTVSMLLFSILTLWGSGAIAADFTFTVPYDFKDLMAPPTIQCFVSDRILDAASAPNDPYLFSSKVKGFTDVIIQLDSFGNAKGTAEVRVNPSISPQNIKSFMCRLGFGAGSMSKWPIGSTTALPPPNTVDTKMFLRYKSGTIITKAYAGTIAQ